MIWDKRLAATVASMGVVAATAVTAALMPSREEHVPIQEPVSGIAVSRSAQPVESESAPDYLYMIKEHEGKIAVFCWGSDTPELILDRHVRLLPEYDRIQLKEGIKIQSGEELDSLIEDFIS